MKDKNQKGDVKMEKVDVSLMANLNKMIEEAIKAEEYKLAQSLGKLQIEIIEERTNAWERGYERGYTLAMKEIKLRRLDEPQS